MRQFLAVGSVCLSMLAVSACVGSEGAAGADGAKGDPGEQGIQGIQGIPGDKGDKGDPGLQGLQGLAGDKGVQGDKGDKGDKGDTGTTGTQGDQGVKGDKGDQGDPGLDWPGPVPAGYAAADGIRGGAAYNEWFATAGGGDGTLAAYGVTNGAEFVRCKSCHAWDGLGNAASYANRTGVGTGAASRPDVSNANLRAAAATNTYQELFDLIQAPWGRPMDALLDSRHPDFSGYLDDAQIWDLVKFMREEWVAPNELYDLAVVGGPMRYEDVAGTWTLVKPTLTYTNIGKDGDATAGKATFTAKCATCHGVDGKTVVIEGLSLGKFVRTKANESWFKIKFGQASGGMLPGLVTATKDLKDLYKAFANTTDFPD